jgi:carboxymuconolactone decarboxylase
MSNRVELENPEDMTEENKSVYDRFPSNLARALLLTRGSAGPHFDLGASFTKGLLSDTDREIIVLRVAKLRNSDFERKLHYHLAIKAGLSAEEIRFIEEGYSDRLSKQRAALVRYVDDCILQHKASEGTFWALREYYSVGQMAEATHLAGHAAMTAMYLASLDIPLDDGLTSWDNLSSD